MIHQTPGGATTFGYLSAVESAEHGFFGGYLLVSPLGRPVEFHCTAPIRPVAGPGNPLRPDAAALFAWRTNRRHTAGKGPDKTANHPNRPALRTLPPPQAQHSDCLLGPQLISNPDGIDASTLRARQRPCFRTHEFELAPGFESDRDAAIALLTTLVQPRRSARAVRAHSRSDPRSTTHRRQGRTHDQAEPTHHGEAA